MLRVVYPQEMAELDRAAMEAGTPSLQLMENAGRSVAEQARDMLGGICSGRRIVVAAAKGNNGGDGLVAARYLASWGAAVRVFLLGDPEELSPDASTNYRRYREEGGEVTVGGAEALAEGLRGADLVIDALFGFGFRGSAKGEFAAAIEAVNACPAPVLSVDIPSGVDAATGEVRGPAVQAQRTVTLAWPKAGLFLYPGAERVGEMVVADIGIPAHLLQEVVKSDIHLLEEGDVAEMIPPLSPHAHKGQRGRVLVAAGSLGLTGAAALASRAALRAGAGVVTLGIAAGLNAVMEVKLTEVMTLPLPDEDGKCLSREAAARVLEEAGRYDVLALGPGLGRAPATAEMVWEILEGWGKPLVLDADGINCAAERPQFLQRREYPTVITPHPGELGGLLGKAASEVQASRLESALAAARAFRCVVVLKGADTVIADPSGKAVFHHLALPELATAGSGDVLTGCIAAFCARGLSPLQAALCGVFLHGSAARLACSVVGGLGMVAGDIISHLPLALAGLRRGKEGGL
ncbi:MAG: NAD(P)H-hydrate dehydratase [Actinobacteria bacterium]|nr:NAD(P)H-hydrate dehydratase [Actinomycetota bacterium]